MAKGQSQLLICHAMTMFFGGNKCSPSKLSGVLVRGATATSSSVS